MMTFEEFANKLQEELKEKLENAGVRILITTVRENNGPDTYALIMKNDVYNISPVIRLQNFYQEYQEGRILSNIVKRIYDMYREHIPEKDFDVSRCMNLDKAKEYIVARLYGTENNAAFLEGKAYTKVDDLVVTYHIHLGYEDGCCESVPVTKEWMERMGVTTEDIHDLAMKNTQRIFPATFQSMQDMMSELMREDIMKEFEISEEEADELIRGTYGDDNFMYVLSNPIQSFGAISVLQPEVMDMIAEQLGDIFYVIPSSIHECIIVPFSDQVSPKELELMVKDVNLTQVAENEILSWHMYQVDAKNHVLLRCDRAKEYEQELKQQEKIKKVDQERKQEKDEKKLPSGPKM